MSFGVDITIDLSPFQELLDKIERGGGELTNTRAAVEQATHDVYGAMVENLRSNGKTRIASKVQVDYPLDSNPFEGEVFVDAPWVKDQIQGVTGAERVRRVVYGGKGPHGYTGQLTGKTVFAQRGNPATRAWRVLKPRNPAKIKNFGRPYKRVPIRLKGGQKTAKGVVEYRTESKVTMKQLKAAADAGVSLAGVFRSGQKYHRQWNMWITVTPDTKWPDIQGYDFMTETYEDMKMEVTKKIRRGFLQDLGIEEN